MGCAQVIQPLLGKEGVRPPEAIRAGTADTTKAQPTAQHAPEEPSPAPLAPLFEGRQHPLCPGRRFHPGPSGPDVSGTFSPGGHCCRLGFRDLGHCVSTSLHPFAPPELPGFVATMGALTPARRLFVSLSGTMNSA